MAGWTLSKPPFDVEEQGGALQARGLSGGDVVDEGGGCVVDREPEEQAALVWVD